jgi:hypothetical protein
MRRLRSWLLVTLTAAACSTGGPVDRDGSPATEAGVSVDASPAEVAADRSLDQTADRGLDDAPADRGLDQGSGDRSTDQSPPDHPADQPGGGINICEGVDAGAVCGGYRQQCCNTGFRCQAGLVCNLLINTCETTPCGDFLQRCCCRAGSTTGCLPDLICQSGTCSRP